MTAAPYPDRLDRHRQTTETVRETTASGLSVLRGWIELMAGGALTDDEQEQAVRSARRRTVDIQEAVDLLIETTTDSRREARSVEAVDLRAVWRQVLGYPLAAADSGPLVVASHQEELAAFLSAAAALLVPEAVIDSTSVAVPLIDAGRMNAAARLRLSSSRGALAQGPTGAEARWTRSSPPPTVNSPHARRK